MSFAQTFNSFQAINLTAGQKLVLGAITTFTDQVGKCWPSIQTIAQRCSLSVRSVQRHIAALVNLGYLQRIYKPGRAAVTRVNLPSTTPAKLAPPPPPNWHPEPAIDEPETKQQRTVAPDLPEQPDSPAIAVVVFEKKEQPEQPDLPPVIDAPGQTDLPEQPGQPEQTNLPPELASVPAELLEDFGLVRRAKKKSPKVTKTEARVFAAEATKAGLTVPEMLKLCILRGWSRFEASWMPTVAPTAPPQAVFKPETAQPNDPMIVSVHRAKLQALRKLIVSQKPLPGHSVLT